MSQPITQSIAQATPALVGGLQLKGDLAEAVEGIAGLVDSHHGNQTAAEASQRGGVEPPPPLSAPASPPGPHLPPTPLPLPSSG